MKETFQGNRGAIGVFNPNIEEAKTFNIGSKNLEFIETEYLIRDTNINKAATMQLRKQSGNNGAVGNAETQFGVVIKNGIHEIQFHGGPGFCWPFAVLESINGMGGHIFGAENIADPEILILANNTSATQQWILREEELATSDQSLIDTKIRDILDEIKNVPLRKLKELSMRRSKGGLFEIKRCTFDHFVAEIKTLYYIDVQKN